MRVVCPFAGAVAAETVSALDASGFPWEAADVSGADTAYTHLLENLWSAGETFALVEHDIVPHPGALEALAACPEPWCAFSYPLGRIVHAGLGCTRFSGELLRAHPSAVRETWREATGIHPAGHWCNLDDRLTRALCRAGAVRHVHEPQVRHLRPQPSHGCVNLLR
jgi:hypothetical protein